MAYASVIANGLAEELASEQDKRHALPCIMAPYTVGGAPWSYAPAQLQRTVLVRVRLLQVPAKARE